MRGKTSSFGQENLQRFWRSYQIMEFRNETGRRCGSDHLFPPEKRGKVFNWEPIGIIYWWRDRCYREGVEVSIYELMFFLGKFNLMSVSFVLVWKRRFWWEIYSIEKKTWYFTDTIKFEITSFDSIRIKTWFYKFSDYHWS